jgi:hypothetical protein
MRRTVIGRRRCISHTKSEEVDWWANLITPCRLVSLLELLEIHGEQFCRLSSMLGQMMVVLEMDNLEGDMKAMVVTLAQLHGVAEKLRLLSVLKQLERVKEAVLSRTATPKVLLPMIRETYNRMRDDMEDRILLTIPVENAGIYRQSEPLFGTDVEAAFTSLSEDIAEAGKCLSLGRSTARVFHLMRIMEGALQKFGEKLGVTLVGTKNWQNILDETNKAIRGLNPKDKQTAAYAEASAHLFNVKLAWRNEVIHPKQTYTQEESRDIFNATGVFIRDLSGLL